MPERPRLPEESAAQVRTLLPPPAVATSLQRALPAVRLQARLALEGDLFGDARIPRRSAPARHHSPSLCPVDPDDADKRVRSLAGFGYSAAHSRYYWGFKLVLLSAPDGTILDFDLVAANTSERESALELLRHNPVEGTTIICDKGFAGRDFEAAVAELRALLLRPSRLDEPGRLDPPIGWIRQRIESIIQTLKGQLLLERHRGRTPAGLLARVTARILTLCASINLNQRLGLASRELTPYAD